MTDVCVNLCRLWDTLTPVPMPRPISPWMTSLMTGRLMLSPTTRLTSVSSSPSISATASARSEVVVAVHSLSLSPALAFRDPGDDWEDRDARTSRNLSELKSPLVST